MGKELLELASSMVRDPATGIKVIVVGGGIAGLGFAIEAYRKGHDVSILERRPDFDDYGDLIAIQESALHTPAQWPGFLEYCKESQVASNGTMHKHDGTLLGNIGFPLGTSRRVFHNALHTYAANLGIPIKFSTRVIDYFETEAHAGVILEDNSKETADIVVAADGIGSKSWNLVSGFKETAISSGFALFRATFPAELALDKPHVAAEYGNKKDYAKLFIGPGAHIIVARANKDMIFMLTHRDTGKAEEEWTKTTSIDYAIPHIEGWAPEIKEVIESAPNREAVDFKLMWRNPRENWASPLKRVIQSGDSAHSFLPTSASGATMALEDAFSLATCLKLAGKKDVPLAVKVHNHLRAERVVCAQRVGFKTREVFHCTDWDAFKEDVTPLVQSMTGKWLVKHNPEKYAYDNYAKCAECMLSGAVFKNTNTVPGYTYKPWTAKELLESSDRGEKLIDEGEWL